MDFSAEPQYEYKTVPVDSHHRKQARELNKLVKEGWEVVSVRRRTLFPWASNEFDATLRRIR